MTDPAGHDAILAALREHRRELNRLRSQVALAIAFGAGALVVIALRLWA